jgi:hypothetical protein
VVVGAEVTTTLMKLVINKCHGGFSLSPKAVARIAELQGRPCYFFTCQSLGNYEPVALEHISQRSALWFAFDIPNPNEVLSRGEGWHSLSMDERKARNELYSKHNHNSRPDNRSDATLIQVVKELGKEADGMCAKLGFVEIPDGIEYEIEEYDGYETVSEAHRSWS